MVAIKVDTSAGAVLSQADNATTDDVTPLTIFTVWDTLLYVKETELGGRSKSLIFSLLKNSQNRSSQKDISRGFILGFFMLISRLIVLSAPKI